MSWPLFGRREARDPQLVEGREARARRLLEQLTLPALVGALLALSPVTGATRRLPALILGACGAAAVYFVRARRAPAALPTRRGFTLAAPSLPTAAVLLLTALVFAPTLRWMYAEYTESIWHNGHGLFVPLFMILLARSVLRRDDSQDEEASAWGFAFLIPALALVIVDAGLRTHYFAAVGLALALPGLSLLLLGARRTRSIALPLALGAFLVPLPNQFEELIGLRAATVAVAKPILSWLDLPVVWHQSQLRLPKGGFSLSQNCSGFSALTAAFAFAALLAATARSRIRGALILLAVFPLVAVANGLRCVALVVLVLLWDQNVLNTAAHGLSGIAVLGSTLGALWLCADRDGLRRALS